MPHGNAAEQCIKADDGRLTEFRSDFPPYMVPLSGQPGAEGDIKAVSSRCHASRSVSVTPAGQSACDVAEVCCLDGSVHRSSASGCERGLLSGTQVRKAIDEAPFTCDEAVERRLIDGSAYR